MRSPTLLFVALLGLAGCTTVNPLTLVRAAQLDPLNENPAHFAVYLSLPEHLDIPAGGAELAFAAERTDTGETFEVRTPLEGARQSDGSLAWRVAVADLPSLRAAQARVRAWKQVAPDATSGSLSVGLTGCARAGQPNPNATVSVDADLDGSGTRLPLIRRLAVGDLMSQAGVAKLPDCSTPPL